MDLRLPTSFAVIFGSFTLGLYVAIQGPTLMDLIDILHVNNDIMSYSLAFASLAYSVGGLLSGFLFNYVNRQLLISAYFLVFGISNMITPFISNYMIFSVITVFKMMCAGGTDCGANVWILEMWPGKDAWLQALHFAFACGCALGPLIVEPFLSVEYKESEIDKIAGKLSGSATISDQNNESRIHIPYGFSGLTSIGAALYILYLYFLEERRRKAALKLKAKKALAAGECILLSAVQHPAAIEAGLAVVKEEEASNEHLESGRNEGEEKEEVDQGSNQQQQQQQQVVPVACKQVDVNVLTETAAFIPPTKTAHQQQDQQDEEEPKEDQQLLNAQQLQSNIITAVAQSNSNNQSAGQAAIVSNNQQSAVTINLGELNNNNSSNNQQQLQQQPEKPQKITSKARSEQVEAGRPPYYVMFAIALAALCLSFYCGIEITSMNYLATFAVNIDLQLPKSTAALMSSALTISFAVGRGIGIWIAAYMKPHKLFYLCAGVMATGNVLMFIFANTAEMLLWYSICLFGIGCGPMFPAIVSFYDDRISKVTNTVSGIFILGSMFNVALNSVIIGHHIIDNALILIVCNLIGSVLLLLLFGTLHMLTKVKKNQRVRKFKLKQRAELNSGNNLVSLGSNNHHQLGATNNNQLELAATINSNSGSEEKHEQTIPEQSAAAAAAEQQQQPSSKPLLPPTTISASGAPPQVSAGADIAAQ